MASFSSFTKTSTNVTQTLNEAASERNIEKEEVDFDLLKTQTLIQSENYKEWTIVEQPLEKAFDEKTIKSPFLLVKQDYEIRVRPFSKDILEKVKIEIAFNKAKSKVIAAFKKGSVFPCDDNLAKLLKRELNKRKLRLGFLIGHFEGDLNATLIKLAKAVKCGAPLSKDVKIAIAQSPGVVFPVDDQIILHYKANQDDKKSMIEGVDADVLIFEYVKPIEGEDGRSCNGEIILASKPKASHANYKADDDTTYAKEDELSVKYYSKIDGYVKNSNQAISISKELTMESATFRKNQSIDTHESQDIYVNIKQKNKTCDAVGSGVVINVKELNVEGTVGSHAQVKAHELSVGEQTHRKARLEAVQNATIHLHRGDLKAKTATIEILENGTVRANEVYVKKMLGGEIIAHKVVVEELASNATIIASESIEVHRISGEHNKLIIDPDKIEDYHEKVSIIKTRLKEKNVLLKDLKAAYSKRLKAHQELLPRIKVFQKRCLLATKEGKTPNKADMIRIKLYKGQTEEFKNELVSINIQKKKILDLNNELEKLYEAEMHATIIHKSDYDGQTKVIFVDVKTSKEYSISPKGSYEKLFLIKDEDDKKISW